MGVVEELQSDWLNQVVHSMKTPIHVVRGALDGVENLGELNPKQADFMHKAFVGVQRLEDLVSRILDLSWVDSDAKPDFSNVSVAGLLERTLEPLREVAARRNIDLQLTLDASVTTIHGDMRRLEMALDNILSNAIKYNRDDGWVKVETLRRGNTLLISIQDSGIGIPLNEHGRIFERFYRSQESLKRRIAGSGLGLAITRGVLEKHKGRIWFESFPDEGTTFYISLPLTQFVPAAATDWGSHTGDSQGEGVDNRATFVRAETASEEVDSVEDASQESPLVRDDDADDKH